jgi:hypothetical protein
MLRSRINWIKDRDANTSLFHANARYRKCKNFIARLTSREGQTLTSHEDMVAELDDFYSGLLGSYESREVTIDLEALGVLSHDLAQLEAPFSEDEVWETITAFRQSSWAGWFHREILQGLLANNQE